MKILTLVCAGSLAVLVACSQQRPAERPPDARPAQPSPVAATSPAAPEVSGPMVKCDLARLSRAERAALDDINTTALFASL